MFLYVFLREDAFLGKDPIRNGTVDGYGGDGLYPLPAFGEAEHRREPSSE